MSHNTRGRAGYWDHLKVCDGFIACILCSHPVKDEVTIKYTQKEHFLEVTDSQDFFVCFMSSGIFQCYFLACGLLNSILKGVVKAHKMSWSW